MNPHSHRGRLAAAAGVGFLLAFASHAESATDPWAKAVALPTACYASQDQFAAKNEVAIESVSAEIGKQ